MSDVAPAPIEEMKSIPSIGLWRGCLEPPHGGSDQLNQLTLAVRPESPLGYMVAPMTVPRSVAPLGDHSTESITFLLPYTEGQIESLLSRPMQGMTKKSGYSLVQGSGRDYETCAAMIEEMKDSSLSQEQCNAIWAGPGGVAPLDWCHHHGITDPLSRKDVRRHYWEHFGIGITDPNGVHAGSIYWRGYGAYNEEQALQYIDGEPIATSPAMFPAARSMLAPPSQAVPAKPVQVQMSTCTGGLNGPFNAPSHGAGASAPGVATPNGPAGISSSLAQDDPRNILSTASLTKIIAQQQEEIASLRAKEVLGHEKSEGEEGHGGVFGSEECEDEDYSGWLDPEGVACLKHDLKLEADEIQSALDTTTEALNTSKSLTIQLNKTASELALETKALAATQEAKIASLQASLNEKSSNEAYSQEQMDASAATAKENAAAEYRPIFAQLAGIIKEACPLFNENLGATAAPPKPPAPSPWFSKPSVPITLDNLNEWKEWIAGIDASQLNNQTMSSIINSSCFAQARALCLQSEAPSECFACGCTVTTDKVTKSAKGGHARRSHVDTNGDATMVAVGECHFATSGSCERCSKHGVNGVKHSQRQCPLRPSVIKSVIASPQILGALKSASKNQPKGSQNQSQSRSQAPLGAHTPAGSAATGTDAMLEQQQAGKKRKRGDNQADSSSHAYPASTAGTPRKGGKASNNRNANRTAAGKGRGGKGRGSGGKGKGLAAKPPGSSQVHGKNLAGAKQAVSDWNAANGAPGTN